MKKKLLVLFLAVVALLGVLVVNASAEEALPETEPALERRVTIATAPAPITKTRITASTAASGPRLFLLPLLRGGTGGVGGVSPFGIVMVVPSDVNNLASAPTITAP